MMPRLNTKTFIELFVDEAFLGSIPKNKVDQFVEDIFGDDLVFIEQIDHKRFYEKRLQENTNDEGYFEDAWYFKD